jgi:molybdopterin-containing oxidoreductase family iron-sulfur binding subunit
MTSSRRDFLKIAGLSLGGAGLGVAGMRLARAEEHAAEAVAAGARWAMAIDIPRWLELDNRSRIFDACHRAHNVPDFSRLEDPDERVRHEIKWIWDEPFENGLPTYYHADLDGRYRDAQIPVLCNHCENPPCVRVCPTQATWKREDGVVMMDMHRCIGCRYCIIACPYGSRSFNFRDPQPYIEQETPIFARRMRGVVEKCNFCSELQENGEYREQPYCVAASEGAMAFGDIRDEGSAVRQMLSGRYSIRRKPDLGTNPHVFYIV